MSNFQRDPQASERDSKATGIHLSIYLFSSALPTCNCSICNWGRHRVCNSQFEKSLDSRWMVNSMKSIHRTVFTEFTGFAVRGDRKDCPSCKLCKELLIWTSESEVQFLKIWKERRETLDSMGRDARGLKAFTWKVHLLKSCTLKSMIIQEHRSL